MIALKQASLIWDPSAFEKIDVNDQKVEANDQKVSAKAKAKTSKKPSAIEKSTAIANQKNPVCQDFKNLPKEELESYMLELKKELKKMEEHYAVVQRIFEEKKKEKATNEAFMKKMECLTPGQKEKVMELMKNL